MSWFCDIIDTANPEQGVLSSGYVAGPTVQIGRREDMELSVFLHMSVSSEHAMLSLEEGELSFTDLGSRTGSFALNKDKASAEAGSPGPGAGVELMPITSGMATGKGERLAAKSVVKLWHGAVVRLGAPVKKAAKTGVLTYALLRFRKMRLAICHTRLDASNKEYVKAAAAALLAAIVPSVEAADVVVATHMSTTVKLLTALALNKNKKLVTPEWLQFSGVFRAGVSAPSMAGGASLSFRTLPPEDQYVPGLDPTSGSQLSQFSQHSPDIKADRSQLLRSFLVCLVYAEDEQYFAILQGCGATCVRLYESGTRHGTNPHMCDEAWINSFPGDCSVRCLFHDEMNYVKRPKQQFAALQELGFRWMNSAVLANTVLRVREPPTTELPALAIEAAAREVDATSPVPVWGGLQSNKCSDNSSNHIGTTTSGNDVSSHVNLINSNSAAQKRAAPITPAAAATTPAASTEEKANKGSRKTVLANNDSEATMPSGKRTKSEVVPELQDNTSDLTTTTSAAGAALPSTPSQASLHSHKLPPAAPTDSANATAAPMDEDEDERVGPDAWETNSERPPTVETLEAIAAAREVELAPSPTTAAKRAAALAMEMQELPLVPVVSKLELATTARSKTAAKSRVGGKAVQEDDTWDFGDNTGAGEEQGKDGKPVSSSRHKHAEAKSSMSGVAVSDSDDDDSADAAAGAGAGAVAVGADGWLTALTGKHARKVLRTKQRQYVEGRQAARLAAAADNGDDDNDQVDAELDDLQPVTDIIDISKFNSNSNFHKHGQAATSSKAAAAAAAASNSRDQRKFRKNFVRVAAPGAVIAARDMDRHCMARESERAAAELEAAEIEAEEDAAQFKFNEEIFADRFSVKPPSVSRARF